MRPKNEIMDMELTTGEANEQLQAENPITKRKS